MQHQVKNKLYHNKHVPRFNGYITDKIIKLTLEIEEMREEIISTSGTTLNRISDITCEDFNKIRIPKMKENCTNIIRLMQIKS